MEYLLKSSAVIALFYLCYNFFLKKETFFEHNRWFLLLGILAAAIFPLIIIPIEIIIEPVAIPENNFIVPENTPINYQEINTAEPFNWINLFSTIYISGVILFLIQFVFRFGSLIVLLLRNPKRKDNLYTYVFIDKKISPFSFFKWIVYNPNSFNDEQLKLMLTHEKIHVDQLHSIDLVFTELARVLFWFNPLIWLYKKDVQQNLEYIADKYTQSKSKTQKDYQRLLLKTSITKYNISFSNNLYNSSIKKRIVMLNKSKSNNKRQWKYLLILPLLAGLLISMNTKEVYVESGVSKTSSDKTIELIVTDKTTDKELEAMSKFVKNHGGSLLFSKIKRNKNNELTNLFVKFYGHSYGGGNSINPINSFLIYKELYGDKGGFVGNLNGSTLHFDDQIDTETIKQERINSLKERAHQYFLKNTKNSIKVIFNKSISDEELENISKELKSQGVEMIINKIKRNNNGEITTINITFKSNDNSANYGVSGSVGIKPFYFEMNEDRFGVGNFGNDEIIIIEEIDTTNNKIQISKPKTFIYNKNEDKLYSVDSTKAKEYDNQKNMMIKKIEEKIKNNDTLYYNSLDSVEIKKLTKLKSDLYFQSDEPTQIQSEHIKILKPNEIKLKSAFDKNPRPLYIVNGKTFEKPISTISSKAIEKMEIIKGEKAIEAYDKKGENGVVIIDLKDENIWTTKSSNKETDAKWEIAYSVQYYDDENPTRNGTLVYIDKDSKDYILDLQKTTLEREDISVKYSKIKRNKNDELVSIKITLENKNGNKTSATYKDNNGIANIEYGISEGKLVVRTSSLN